MTMQDLSRPIRLNGNVDVSSLAATVAVYRDAAQEVRGELLPAATTAGGELSLAFLTTDPEPLFSAALKAEAEFARMEGELLPEIAEQRQAEAIPALSKTIDAAFRAWDGGALNAAKRFARLAYPSLPAGADEALLRDEMQLILAGSETQLAGLMAMAAGPRRDLAALALGSWASTIGGLAGFGAGEFGAVRVAALDGAAEHGTPAEQAAARVYRELLGVLPTLRMCLVDVVESLSRCVHLAQASGMVSPAVAGEAALRELQTWMQQGPQDAPPVVRPLA